MVFDVNISRNLLFIHRNAFVCVFFYAKITTIFSRRATIVFGFDSGAKRSAKEAT